MAETGLPGIFVSPKTKRPLSMDTTGARLVAIGDSESWPVINGIPDFTRRRRPDRFGEQIRAGKWVEANWRKERKRHQADTEPQWPGPQLAATDGLVLEVAAGPGGGNLPKILLAGPRGTVLVNDISRMILEDWAGVLNQDGLRQRVSFAAFNARRMPLPAESVDAVSTCGGISNVLFHHRLVNEIVRVLKPGGQVYSVDLEFDAAEWARIPRPKRLLLEAVYPVIPLGFRRLFERHGLTVQHYAVRSTRELEPKEGFIPAMAHRSGVTLHVNIVEVLATKPGRP